MADSDTQVNFVLSHIVIGCEVLEVLEVNLRTRQILRRL